MNAETFWDNVKPLIKQEKTTQEGLAKTCSISFNTMQSWITKNRLPDAVSAFKIAQALNTTVEYLVTGEDSNPYKAELEKMKSAIIPFIGNFK